MAPIGSIMKTPWCRPPWGLGLRARPV